MNIVVPRRAALSAAALMAALAVTACVATARHAPAPSPSPSPSPSPLPSARAATTSPAPTIALPTQLRVRVAGKIESVSLDDYVLGAVLSEVTPLGESDAAVATIYEVQAIVARSYAVFQSGPGSGTPLSRKRLRL